MKKIFICYVLAVAVVGFSSCELGEKPNKPDNEQTDPDDDSPATIPENMETAFPDPIFRAYVLDNFDSDHNGQLSQEEALNVIRIEVGNNHNTPDSDKITSLKGIQYFVNLEYLDCSYNLIDAYVSHNTALTYLDCSHNHLTHLDVMQNTELSYLDCSNNRLTEWVEVSKNTELVYLDCSDNQLTHLDVSHNPELTELDCSDNHLRSLDLTQNTKLIKFSCASNQFTDLNFINNTALTELDCSDNQLRGLDLTTNSALTILYCHSNPFTSLDISNTNLNGGTLKCAPMETLEVLYLKTGWDIYGITTDRSSEYIPEHTEIEFVD